MRGRDIFRDIRGVGTSDKKEDLIQYQLDDIDTLVNRVLSKSDGLLN